MTRHGPAPKPLDERLGAAPGSQLRLRWLPAELDELRAWAARAGRSLSALCRDRLLRAARSRPRP